MHLRMSVRKRKRWNDERVEWERERKGRQEEKRDKDRDKETEIDGENTKDSQRIAKMYG